jgi:glycosyltransferase involved in cell wall biosynthesis
LDLIKRCGLESRLKWLGYVPNSHLPALLSGADLFVYPSLFEGFGLPPLEAMACGTPVAVSRNTSLPEVVGEAGEYFDPKDISAIAEAMHKLLISKSLRAERRLSGLRRARNFSWNQTARLTIEAYEQASKRSKAFVRPLSMKRISPTNNQREERQSVLERISESISPPTSSV